MGGSFGYEVRPFVEGGVNWGRPDVLEGEGAVLQFEVAAGGERVVGGEDDGTGVGEAG